MPSTMTPLRYPGGKSKLKKYMRQIIAVNGLEGGTYVEPYAGGAGIAVDLILSGTVSKAILNDIDPSIFAFWHSVLYDTDALCEQIRYTPVLLCLQFLNILLADIPGNRLNIVSIERLNMALVDLAFPLVDKGIALTWL